MRALPALLLIGCSAAKPPPASAGLAPCDALPLLGRLEPISMASDPAGGLAVTGKFEGTLRAVDIDLSADVLTRLDQTLAAVA